MAPPAERTVPELPFEVLPPFPPGDPRWRELAFLRMGPPGDRVWRRMDKFGRRARRAGTYASPLAFAYVYLGHALEPVRPLLPEFKTDPHATPVVSFSAFHLEMAEIAKAWMQPGGQRVGIIAPRGAAKSTWGFLILPLWAIAHGHRQFFMGYAHANDQAVRMLDKIRAQLTHNELLLFDFPELALPKGGRDNSQQVEVASGAEFGTAGIDKVTLGASTKKSKRPDAISIDDGQPNASNYHKDDKSKRLDTIRDVILRMTPEAAVLMSGTVVMPKCIAHDLVRKALGEETAAWVDEEQFDVRYFNAILDEGSSGERSLWPERWSLEFLQWHSKTNPAKHALHYANRPPTRGGKYWQAEDFRRNPHFPIDHWVMYVDPAEVAEEGRDYTAVVVVGANATRDWASVIYARQDHMHDVDLAKGIASYKRNHPEIPLLRVYVEGYNSGPLRLRTLQEYMPEGVKLELDRPPREGTSATGQRGKYARIERAYAYYQSGRVWHARPFTDLEDQLTSFPKLRHDDLADALAGALRKVFEH